MNLREIADNTIIVHRRSNGSTFVLYTITEGSLRACFTV